MVCFSQQDSTDVNKRFIISHAINVRIACLSYDSLVLVFINKFIVFFILLVQTASVEFANCATVLKN